MKLLFIDLETTGFSREWDDIIEFAAILYDTETGKRLDTFHEYSRPKKPISEKITSITGITNDMVYNARSEADVYCDFAEFVAMSNADYLVGHNYNSFDGQFLVAKGLKYNVKFPSTPTIDTLAVARAKKIPVSRKTATGKPQYTQPSLAEHYGIVYQAHSAIEDVKALILIYEKMEQNQDVQTKRASLGF